MLVRSQLPAYLTGRRLSEFEVDGEIRVVELTRGGRSLLPAHGTVAEPDDLVTFAVGATALGRAAQLPQQGARNMKVLIVGAGRLGTQIAQVLTATGDDVSLIDIDDDRIAELQGHISARQMAGDACELTVLEDAGALTTGLLVAATGDDEDNLVISLLAKRQFAVPRVAARINDTDNGWLFDHHWGVDVAVPAATPLISLIEEATGTTDTVAQPPPPQQGSRWVLAAWGSRETGVVARVRVVTGRRCWRQVCCPCAGRRRDRFRAGSGRGFSRAAGNGRRA